MDAARRQLSIVVPTYREALNLRELCLRTFAATRGARIDAELVIVDDDSNDGTQAVVRELAAEHDIRIIVRRGERGLSSAVVRGFEESRHDVLMVMDADLSHPPEQLPELAETVFTDEADFVIGSRYVGGGVTADWPIARKLNSLLATLPARLLVPVRDPMAGFFCLRRSTWERAEGLRPMGYKIGLELMVKCRCRRYREIPITFAERAAGESKLTLGQQLLYLRQLIGLYTFRFPAAVIAGGAVIVIVGAFLLLT